MIKNSPQYAVQLFKNVFNISAIKQQKTLKTDKNDLVLKPKKELSMSKL